MRVQSEGREFHTVWREGSEVHMIDQNLLPFEFGIYIAPTVSDSCKAIERMAVRGAGAIEATAAYAMAQAFSENDPDNARMAIEATRRTARNLFFATDRVYSAAISSERSEAAAWEEADMIAEENIQACKKIGEHGSKLIGNWNTIVTHCNAGWLAMVDWGSALSPVYAAYRQSKNVRVFVNDTQPRQQGGRLTAWELWNADIDHEIVPDTGMADLLYNERPNMVIVGADRIAANGDVANKIGTFTLAIVAHELEVPVYVAAPLSTIDAETADGDGIEIEMRSEDEVRYKTGLDEKGKTRTVVVTNPDSPVRNRAFDVTPAKYITGLITEMGIIRPTPEEIATVMQNAA